MTESQNLTFSVQVKGLFLQDYRKIDEVNEESTIEQLKYVLGSLDTTFSIPEDHEILLFLPNSKKSIPNNKKLGTLPRDGNVLQLEMSSQKKKESSNGFCYSCLFLAYSCGLWCLCCPCFVINSCCCRGDLDFGNTETNEKL